MIVDPDISEGNLPERRLPDPAPGPLRVAAVVVALEGAVALAYGVAEALNITGSRAVMGATTSLFFVGTGLGLLLCAWGLLRVRSWARGPVLLAQLMALGLAWNFRGDETGWISVLLLVPGAIGLGAMVHPRTVQALSQDEAPS